MLYRIAGLTSVFLLLVLNSCNEIQNQNYEQLSFAEDIQPIIHEHCSTCHNNEGAAPFDLITYSDIQRKAKTIKEVVNSGYMPPWPADPNYRRFIGEKLLPESDRNKLIAWLSGEMKSEPDSSIMPSFKTGSSNSEKFCLTEPIEIKGNNKDHFKLAKIPIELERDTFLSHIEFIPDNRKLVHHMNGHWLNYIPSKKTVLNSGVSSVNTDADTDLRLFLELGIPHDDGSFPSLVSSVVNYLPGMQALKYPEGIGGFKISQKSSLLMQSIHYGPSPKDTIDQSCIVLHYTDKPPERPLKELQLGSLGKSPVEPPLKIEPETTKDFVTRWTTEKDMSLLTVIPHMHLLGTKFKAYALSPNQDTIRLIKINEWDFRWQYFYTFEKIQKIPAGSTIVAEASFDNTSANPNQAFDPPRTVLEPRSLDMKTTDEMFQLIIMYIDYKNGDEDISLIP